MFEYDPDKSAANLVKHGIDFDEGQAIWNDKERIVVPANAGPDSEARSLVIGKIGQKLWSAVITLRVQSIRIISVRRARQDEKDLYDGEDN